MRTLILSLLGIIIIAGVLPATVGVEPQDRRPGTRLAGEEVALPADWSFTDSVQEVHIETRPWYGIPFSVTTVLARDGQELFAPSIYSEPAQFPGSKYWNSVVAADPNIRLRVGDQLFPLAITPIADPAQFDRALDALARKYPFWAKAQATKRTDPDAPPHFVLLQLAPR